MALPTKDQITEAPAFQTMEEQAREQQAESVEEPAAGTATTTDTQSGTATGSGSTTTTQ